MNPLFSFTTTLYALVLFYFPSIFSGFLLSPAVFSTLILLLYLLRLGAAQRSAIKQTESDSDSDSDSVELDSNQIEAKKFVEWDVRAPLEVIYEEYEGEDDNSEMNTIRQYALFYPDSDTDSSSEGDFPAWGSLESASFRWEDDDREGLIEIALDRKKNPACEVDDDNFIEIDLSPER